MTDEMRYAKQAVEAAEAAGATYADARVNHKWGGEFDGGFGGGLHDPCDGGDGGFDLVPDLDVYPRA